METYNEMLAEFKEWVTTDKKAQALWDKVNKGKATWKDAKSYALQVGAKWSRLFENKFKNTEDFANYVDDINKSLHKVYSESAYYTKAVQKDTNMSNKIGMNVVEPRMDEERITNFIDKLITGEALWLFGKDAIGNIAESAIADTIQYNARIQSEFGIKAYIERDTGNGCCEWCESLAGRYIYGEQPSDFFAIHKDCTCVFNYHPVKAPTQRMRYEQGRRIVE